MFPARVVSSPNFDSVLIVTHCTLPSLISPMFPFFRSRSSHSLPPPTPPLLQGASSTRAFWTSGATSSSASWRCCCATRWCASPQTSEHFSTSLQRRWGPLRLLVRAVKPLPPSRPAVATKLLQPPAAQGLPPLRATSEEAAAAMVTHPAHLQRLPHRRACEAWWTRFWHRSPRVTRPAAVVTQRRAAAAAV